ncbi:MAG: hypothetical protein QNK11_06330, partial [Legionella sp.]|nr:hypothetical protein [Legionella sp.]
EEAKKLKEAEEAKKLKEAEEAKKLKETKKLEEAQVIKIQALTRGKQVLDPLKKEKLKIETEKLKIETEKKVDDAVTQAKTKVSDAPAEHIKLNPKFKAAEEKTHKLFDAVKKKMLELADDNAEDAVKDLHQYLRTELDEISKSCPEDGFVSEYVMPPLRKLLNACVMFFNAVFQPSKAFAFFENPTYTNLKKTVSETLDELDAAHGTEHFKGFSHA